MSMSTGSQTGIKIQFWLVTLVRVCRQVTDTRLAPRHLRIRHRRDETPLEMKSFFGTTSNLALLATR